MLHITPFKFINVLCCGSMQIPDVIQFHKFRRAKRPAAVKEFLHVFGQHKITHSPLAERIDGELHVSVDFVMYKAVITVSYQIALRTLKRNWLLQPRHVTMKAVVFNIRGKPVRIFSHLCIDGLISGSNCFNARDSHLRL